MGDRIEITGLRAVGIVGVLPHERTAAQPLRIDVALEADLRAAGHSDRLDDTVDYGTVAEPLAPNPCTPGWEDTVGLEGIRNCGSLAALRASGQPTPSATSTARTRSG